MLQTGSWCWSKILLAHVFLHVYPWCSATTQAEDAYSFFVRCSTIMKKQAFLYINLWDCYGLRGSSGAGSFAETFARLSRNFRKIIPVLWRFLRHT